MSQGLSQDAAELRPAAADRRPVWPLIAAAVVIGGLMAVAVALWLHYGTAVFFEIVRAGIAACF
jgi:ABC-type amino acid transport system permease subunit